MTYEMNPAQYESVLGLSARERYSHFIGKVADWEQLWVLVDPRGDWLMRVTPDERVFTTVWPHPEYALRIAGEFFPDYSPKVVPLNEFMEVILPAMINENQRISVFPDFNGKSWMIEARDLLEDLQEECDQYE